MNNLRIGELLVRRGVLNNAQVAAILEAQGNSHRPFGELAENMYGVDPTDIEQAWVEQYASFTRRVDLASEHIEPEAKRRIDPRQAWQFRVVPVRFDGRELMVATTSDNLCRALRFVTRCLRDPCYLVLAEPRALGEALEKEFALAGMTADLGAQPKLHPLSLLSDN